MNRLIISIIFLIEVNNVACQCVSASGKIDADFPGGNITVENIRGDTIQLSQDLRDTEGNWFYWSFRVCGAAGRTLYFEFTNGSAISSRGPAVSIDSGLTWRWLGELGFSDTKFQYTFSPGEDEVYFGVGMNYTEKNLRYFLKRYKDHPDLRIKTLCTSQKGRKVELLRIYDNKSVPEFKVFLSSRHHCCEMMANYTLEGIIETVLSDSDDGKWLRHHGDFFIVPFVDKDGVEDGDQGKNRRPHDYNRDYIQRIYPEIRAITEQVRAWSAGKPLFFHDMHSPWLRGGDDGNAPEKGTNEFFYYVGIDPAVSPKNFEQQYRFSTILEKVKRGAIPYRAPWNLPFGVSWNTSSNVKTPDFQKSSAWGSTLPNTIFSGSFELPFANSSGVVVDANTARDLGHDLAHAIRIYLESYKCEK